MKNKISKTILAGAISAFTASLSAKGINIGSSNEQELEQHLEAFLFKECSVATVDDAELVDKTKAHLTVDRRISAIVNENIEYELDKSVWLKALDENDGNVNDALDEVQSDNTSGLVRIDYASDVDDMTTVHSANVNVELFD